MNCPRCESTGQVIETRRRPDGVTRRRYECAQHHRFSTLEHHAVLAVGKKSPPLVLPVFPSWMGGRRA